MDLLRRTAVRPPVAVQSRDKMMWEKWISSALFVAVVASLVSIAVSEIFFAITLILWAGHCFSRKELYLRAPPIAVFILLFILAILVSVLFSADILISLGYLKKLLKFMYVFLIYTYMTRKQVEGLLLALFVVMSVSALYGIGQYYWLMDVDLLNRIRGFMGHWMTFSGQLMLILVAFAGYLLWYRIPATLAADSSAGREEGNRRPWTFPLWLWLSLFGLQVFALVLTQTRSMWIGAAGGLLLLLWIAGPRKLIAGLGVLSLLFVLFPTSFKDRLYSSFDSQDTTTRIRLELIRTGGNMIAAHPLTGLGPSMVSRLHENFHGENEFPGWIYQHLHNNFIQIAAELGIVTLLAWLGLWMRLLWDFMRLSRTLVEKDPARSAMALGGVAVVSAFLLGGVFEYNFGDSEILILLLALVTIPYVGNGPQAQDA